MSRPADPGPSEDLGTNPLTVALPVALGTVAAGVALGSVTVLLAGVVPLAYGVYGRSPSLPEADLAVERTVSEDAPRPGETVAVTLTVANAGETVLPDVRIADGVPDRLAVVEGDTACCTSLRPGEAATVSYTVRARRGTVAFESPFVELRSVGGGRGQVVETAVETTITCETSVDAVPLRDARGLVSGHVETSEGGEGVTFAASRPYQRGDPVGRIDWKRSAATGDLTTVQFRETRAATVLVLLDTSEAARTAGRPDGPTALSLSTDAASRLVGTLLDGRNRVGLATLGTTNDYLAPDTGREQALEVERLLEGADAVDVETLATLPGLKPDVSRLADERALSDLLERVPPETQVVFCTPLLTDDAASVADALAARDHDVLVVSPDVTNGTTTGGTLARVDRALRLRRLRRSGVRTVDWSPSDSLDAAFARAREGWSR